MAEPRNRVVQVRRFGGPDELEVVDAPLPTAGQREVRVRVLASSVVYTDVVIRRHLYPQTMRLQPPFVLGYDVVGEIDQLGEGVKGFQLGDRVADMTVVGSNAAYRTLRADDLTRAPAGVDPAEAATLILSWTTAYQLLHREARVQGGQRVLVQGAAGAVGQALLTLGRIAGLEMWGTARREHAALVEFGATPIDYQREDFTRVLPGGFDVVFDGIGEDGYRRSFAALRAGGLLCPYGYTASVQPERRLLTLLMQMARVYLWRSLLSWLPGGKRVRIYSINLMRARHPAWFREDLGRLFELLATGAVRPRVAERISFDEVVEAHRRLEAGGLEGKLVLCPDLPPRRGQAPIGTGDVFSKGRDFGAWLGLVPKQISTGDRTILGKISWRGIATCAFCSCRRLGLCWSRSRTGNVTGSNPGSKPPRGGCTTTCWRLRSLTSLPASPGPCWLKDAPSS